MFLDYIKNLTEHVVLYNKNNEHLENAIFYNKILFESLYNKNYSFNKMLINRQIGSGIKQTKEKLDKLKKLQDETIKNLETFLLSIKNGKKNVDGVLALGLINGLMDYIKMLISVIDDAKLDEFHNQLTELKNFLSEY